MVHLSRHFFSYSPFTIDPIWVVGGMTAGIFLGEGLTSIERLSMLTSWFVTIATIYFGLRIIYLAWRFRGWVLIFSVIATFVANLLFSLSVKPESVVNMVFDLSTFLALLALMKYAQIGYTFPFIGNPKISWSDKTCPTCNQRIFGAGK